jgi:hypothetical protein
MKQEKTRSLPPLCRRRIYIPVCTYYYPLVPDSA